MWASASGKLDTVLTLLKYGADVNAQTNVRNQMMMMTLIILLTIMLMTMMIVINEEDLDDCYL